VIGCVRTMLLMELCVFVRGHLKPCVANRFAHHPPNVQLNVVHVPLREIEIVRPSNMKDSTLEIGVENAGLSAGEGVDCNL